MSKFLPSSVFSVAIITTTGTVNQREIFLDSSNSLPLIDFKTTSFRNNMNMLLSKFGFTGGTYEGVLAIYSSSKNSVCEFLFVMLCTVPTTKYEALSTGGFHVIDANLLECISRDERLPNSVKLECTNIFKNFDRHPLQFEDDNTNDIPPYPVSLELVVWVLIVDHGQIVLIKEPPEKGGGWYLPAGHFERSENIITASKRETREESGLEIEVEQIAQVIYEWGTHPLLDFAVKARVTGGNLKTKPDKESQCAKWFDLKTVMEDVKLNDKNTLYRKPWELNYIFSIVFDNGGEYRNTTVPVLF